METKTVIISGKEIDYCHYSAIDSTNTECKRRINKGISRPLLITSDMQTSGRGRTGKTFLSPRGGLYMSLALPCSLPFDSSVKVTTCCAVCVCRALKKYNIDPSIKWVNDIFVSGKKLSGILVEATNDYTNMNTTNLIIGIGINIVESPVINDDYDTVSVSELGVTLTPEELCISTANEIISMYDKSFDFSLVKNEYSSLSCVLGRDITYILNGVIYSGKALNITDNGGLTVMTDSETVTLTSGEVSLRFDN